MNKLQDNVSLTFMKMLLTALVPVCFFCIYSTPCKAAGNRDQLLGNGRYQELITDANAPRDGHYAFARFFLLPDFETYHTALAGHNKGDLLATFILMRCHMDGAGVRRDQKIRWACNVKLRKALEKRQPRSALDSYMLSYLSEADENGAISVSSFKDSSDAYKIAGKYAREHLRDSAKAGFAQALVEVGAKEQQSSPESAIKHYREAAEMGLASGMKDLGFMLAVGQAPRGKDAAQAMSWTRHAAKGGDIYAMVNLAAFYERLKIEGSSEQEAQKWVKNAVATGHSLGFMEKGLALLNGSYGYPINRPAGVALLQKAAATGHSFALGQLAYFYSDGIGVKKNHKMSLLLAKAAWIQGNTSSLKTIAWCYKKDPQLAKDKAAANYWSLLATGGGLAFAMGRDKPGKELATELANLDPFTIKLPKETE